MTQTAAPTSGPGHYVVADIGGTSLRICRVAAGSDQVSDAQRMPTEGLGRYPQASAEELQRRVVDQLATSLDAYLRSPAGVGADAVGLSFAGPMTQDGAVTAAPTIWGASTLPPLRIGEVLEQRLGLPVIAANDITAAAWRYAADESQSFSIITVSSGIGSKVFSDGRVLVGESGHGGELGHWRVDASPDALLCDCGGRGHLGAIASGRGVLAGARRAAARDPERFARSVLAEAAKGLPEGITNEELAKAVRTGDAFATGVLREALGPLASAVGCVFAAIGVRRHVFIGGFALAVGERFVELLGEELVRLGCFGLSPQETRAMLHMGFDDDDHSLVGMGRLLSRSLPERRADGRHDADADHR
jgi:C7-cyclitol 7-kinase